MAQRVSNEIAGLVSKWETTGAPDALSRLVKVCGSNPGALLYLSHRGRELFRRLQESQQLLAEVKQEIERRQSTRHIAAFIGEGPPDADGGRTAIVDRGGPRCVAPVAQHVDIEALRGTTYLLIDQEGVVVDALREYQPPTELGRVVEAGGSQLMVELHADERVNVDVRDSLRGDFRAGDRVTVDRRHSLAVGRLEAAEDVAEWFLERTPSERFSDVGGQDEVIRAVKERVFLPLQRPELMEELKLEKSSAILLIGSTGQGKTTIARAVAGEMSELFGDAVFLRVKAGGLKSKWYGETTQRIQRLWAYARREAESGKMIVIFVDECDAIGGMRSHGGEYGMHAERDATNSWLGEMDGLDSDHLRQNIIVIASTNLMKSLDSAFVSRFSLSLPVRRPDAEGARQIFRVHLHPELPIASSREELIDEVLDAFYNDDDGVLLMAHLRDGKRVESIRRSHLISGRMIRDCVANAKWQVVREVVESGAEPVLRASHLRQALADLLMETASKITPWNAPTYVDLPSVQEGEVARVELVAAPSPSWGYIS